MPTSFKKGQSVKDDNIVYTLDDTHKVNIEALLGDCGEVKELIIGGDRYKVQTDEKGNYSLIRFNEKYKMWVKISFMGLSKDLHSTITEVLRKQYIDRVLTEKCS